MNANGNVRYAILLFAGALLADASPTLAQVAADTAPVAVSEPPQGATVPPSAEPSRKTPATVIPVAITSQGGISLGAYEAGLQWAIMELLRYRASDDSFLQKRKEPVQFPDLRIRLVASAGASAGNANTFLGLLNYCRADTAPEEEKKCDEQDIPNGSCYADNWFWETWVPMGIDQLFPVDEKLSGYCLDLGARSSDELSRCLAELRMNSAGSVYRPDDALLSRNAYNRMEYLLRRMIAPADGKPLPIMDPNCLYPVGVPLTQTSASPIGWDGELEPTDGPDQIEIPVGRALAVLQPECEVGEIGKNGACSIRLKNYDWSRSAAGKDAQKDRLGWVLDLPEELYKNGQRISADTVNVLIEAGSAVPFAFGAKKLEFCDQDGERPVAEGTVCPDGKTGSVKRRHWYDGGTFDNLPIGLAHELAAARQNLEPTHIIALDVSRPRYEPKYRGQPTPPKDDLFGVLGTLSSVIPIARKYELQGLARYMSQAEKKTDSPPADGLGIAVHPTSRYFPVVGESLGAFGAFLGRPFREYDFHMGVYDGIHYLAQAMCVGFGTPNKEGLAPDAWLTKVKEYNWEGANKDDLRECVVEIFKESYAALGLQETDLPQTKLAVLDNETEFQKFAGSVAVLTALATEIKVTGSFVVDGVQIEDFQPGPARVPRSGSGKVEKHIDFGAFGALSDRILKVPEEALTDRAVKAQRKAGRGEKDGDEDGLGGCTPPDRPNKKFSGSETAARYSVFRNVLKTGQCIATNGPAEHPDSDDFWIADFLGPDFLFFAGNLRKVDKDLQWLRGAYLTWKKECKKILSEGGTADEIKQCESRAVPYIEEGLAMNIRPARDFDGKPRRNPADRYEGFVENPENWSMVFAGRLLNRLAEQNDEHGFSEVVVDMAQLVLRFEERQTAPGFQFGPSITPWRVDGGQRAAVAASRLFLPSFLGTGVEFYTSGRNSSAMAFSLEFWRTQLAFAKGHFVLYLTPQMNFQATEYQRFMIGPLVGVGVRTDNLVVSEVEVWGGPSIVAPGEQNPFGYSAAYPMWQVGGSLYFFGSMLRLTGGVRFYSLDGLSTDNPTPFFTVGICDIPGIAYWILKIAT